MERIIGINTNNGIYCFFNENEEIKVMLPNKEVYELINYSIEKIEHELICESSPFMVKVHEILRFSYKNQDNKIIKVSETYPLYWKHFVEVEFMGKKVNMYCNF